MRSCGIWWFRPAATIPTVTAPLSIHQQRFSCVSPRASFIDVSSKRSDLRETVPFKTRPTQCPWSRRCPWSQAWVWSRALAHERWAASVGRAHENAGGPLEPPASIAVEMERRAARPLGTPPHDVLHGDLVARFGLLGQHVVDVHGTG